VNAGELTARVLVLPRRYLDSLVLMRVARDLGERPGIAAAAAVMGTPANRADLVEAGFDAPGRGGATADDLVIAVRGDPAAAAAALDAVEGMLAAGAALQSRCACDWPCQESWQAVYRATGSVEAAVDHIASVESKLPRLEAAARIVSSATGSRDRAADGSPIAEAQSALAAGRVDEAAAIADDIVAAQQRLHALQTELAAAYQRWQELEALADLQ